MEIFSWILLLLGGGIVLVALAERIGAPYPAFLAVAGAAVALLLPDAPRLHIAPDVVLALFISSMSQDASA